ncbi:hypothetical protein SUNI508_13966 [Seiridium unicorne]|uniref:Uncharacterized protein n=1 Tax=Seiridium unicorne TaxID=138068 RepID=A0ABR2V9X3_9PEZI
MSFNGSMHQIQKFNFGRHPGLEPLIDDSNESTSQIGKYIVGLANKIKTHEAASIANKRWVFERRSC